MLSTQHCGMEEKAQKIQHVLSQSSQQDSNQIDKKTPTDTVPENADNCLNNNKKEKIIVFSMVTDIKTYRDNNRKQELTCYAAR